MPFDPDSVPKKPLKRASHPVVARTLDSLAEPGEILRSAWYYVFGAYTGVFVFSTAAALFFAAAAVRMRALSGAGRALLAGVLLLVTAYLVWGVDNYFGGGQTVGNRWFLKAIPAILALSVAMRMSALAARSLCIAGVSDRRLSSRTRTFDIEECSPNAGRPPACSGGFHSKSISPASCMSSMTNASTSACSRGNRNGFRSRKTARISCVWKMAFFTNRSG